MPAFLIPILAAVKPLAISYLLGQAMKGAINATKFLAPKFWCWIPAPARPYVSTVLGTLAGAAVGDPSSLIQMAGAAAAGGVGGIVAKAQHEDEKKAAKEACPPDAALPWIEKSASE